MLIMNIIILCKGILLPRNPNTLYVSKFSGLLKLFKLLIFLGIKGSEQMAQKMMNHLIQKRNSGSNLFAQ